MARTRRKVDLYTRDLHAYYKKTGGTLGQTEFNRILKAFHDRAVREILVPGRILYLPHGFGNIQVVGRKPVIELDENFKVVSHNLPINWQKTKQLWKRDPQKKEDREVVYHDNSHSDDIVYRVRWLRPTCANGPDGLSTYAFRPARGFKKLLKNRLKPE